MQNSIVSLVRYLFVVVLLHVEDYLGSVLIICLALWLASRTTWPYSSLPHDNLCLPWNNLPVVAH